MLTGNPQNVTNGTADVQTETDTTYYLGMYGDTLPGGSTSTTQVSDSLGDKLDDYNALAGQPLEVQTFDAGGGYVGSAAAIVHMYDQRQQEQQQAYNKLASSVENRQLENCYCRMNTMQAIIGEYHNPVYVQQRVSQYDATAAYDARMLRQAEIERAREAAQARQNRGGCGGWFGWAECAGRWAAHTYEHNAIVQNVVNSIVETALVAACPESLGAACGLAVAFAAGGALSTALPVDESAQESYGLRAVFR